MGKRLLLLAAVVALAGCGSSAKKAAPTTTVAATATTTAVTSASDIVKRLQAANAGCLDVQQKGAFDMLDGTHVVDEVECTAKGKNLTINVYEGNADATASTTKASNCAPPVPADYVARYVLGPNWTIYMQDQVNDAVAKAAGGTVIVVGCGA